MKKQLSFKGISWLLILALLALPLVSTWPVRAEPGCVDEWSGTVYERGEECPPQELLNTTRPNSKERSELLDGWFNKLDKDTRAAYRKYIKCEQDLAKLEEELKNAEVDKSLHEQLVAAKKELKRTLVAAMGRVGLTVFEIFVNAASDAYLFGKALQDAVADEGGASAKARAEFEVAADRAQRLTTEAAKRQKYVASLEADLAAAEQRIAAAEARQTAAAGTGGPPGEKPPSASGGPGEPPAKPPQETPPSGSGESGTKPTSPGEPGAPSGGPGGATAAAQGGKPPVRLGLGLKSARKGLDYVKWSKERGFHTYGELSGRGSFPEQIRQAMGAADEIHFNLDGVDVRRRSGELNDYGEPAGGYTNYELYMIETNPQYRAKTIWHEGGQVKPPGFDPFR